MIRINLLPVRISKKKEAGRQQLILFGLVALLAVIGNFWWHKSRADDLAAREGKLRRTKEDIAQLERIIGEVKNIKEQQAALKDKLAVLDKLKAGRTGPVKMLDDLATIVPKKVWVKKMEEKDGQMGLEGSAASIDDVSAFLSALKRSRYFKAVELKKTTARTEGKARLVDFTLTARADYTPADQAAAAPVPGAKPR